MSDRLSKTYKELDKKGKHWKVALAQNYANARSNVVSGATII